MNPGWQQPVETLHYFHLDRQPTAHRWKVDWEKGRGQTGRRTNSGQTQHLTRNHSHTMKSWDLETGDAKTIISECPGFKGTSFDWIKMQKRKKRRKHGLTMYKKEKVIFNFLDDFRSKMICNYWTRPDLHFNLSGQHKKDNLIILNLEKNILSAQWFGNSNA